MGAAAGNEGRVRDAGLACSRVAAFRVARSVLLFVCVSCILAFALGVSAVFSAAAFADSKATYVDSEESFVFSYEGQTYPYDLFEQFKGVMPGDVLAQRVVVSNAAENSKTVAISFQLDGVAEESRELFSYFRLKVTQEGTGAVLYDGSCADSVLMNEAAELGSFAPGEGTALIVELTVSPELDSAHASEMGTCYGTFRAKIEENQAEERIGGLPITGDQMKLIVAAIAVLAIVAIIVAIAVSRRRRR